MLLGSMVIKLKRYNSSVAHLGINMNYHPLHTGDILHQFLDVGGYNATQTLKLTHLSAITL